MTKLSADLLSIVLPVHNQSDHIRNIVTGYQTAMEKVPLPYELVLVTNACKDDTPAICQQLSGEFPNIQSVDTPTPGWGNAVLLGLEAAKGDLLCYTNSARTSPEVLVLMVLYGIANPGSVIKANRKIRDNWKRRLGSLIYNLECKALFDLPNWDINGTPKIFPRQYDKLLSMNRRDDLIDAEFNAICRRENYPLIEVPIISTRRHGGKSTTNYGSALRMYIGAYQLWKSFPAKT